MAATPFAHRRLRVNRHLQFGAAIKAGKPPSFRRWFRGFLFWFRDIVNAKVLAAFLADRGEGGARPRLLVPAMRTRQQILFLLDRRRHSTLASPWEGGRKI